MIGGGNKLNNDDMKVIKFARRLFQLLLLWSFVIHFGVARAGNDPVCKGRYRIDLTFVGNKTKQDVYLKGMQWDEKVSIAASQRHPKYEYGEYQVVLTDSASHRMLFSRGFCALFFEWRTTDMSLHTDAAYDQSIFVPACSSPFRLTVRARNKNTGVYAELKHWDINPVKRPIPRQPAASYASSPVILNGDPEHKVDLVFLAEGYTVEEKEKFRKDVSRMLDELFKTEPYSRHLSDFNVWMVESYSRESGTTIPYQGVYKNTAFSSSFNSLQMARYLMIDNQTAVLQAVAGVPCDVAYVLVNTNEYGGGGIYNYYGMSASDSRLSTIVFVHEFGHLFAGLADEYADSPTTYSDFYSATAEPWEPNITNFVHFERKWKNSLKANTPIPTPESQKDIYPLGAFEGAAYLSKGLFRPAWDCRMRTNTAPGFCPVCSQAIERMIQFYCR